MNCEKANPKTSTRQCLIGKQKYKIVSYYIGDKDINAVIEDLAIRKTLYEYNYNRFADGENRKSEIVP